MSLREISVTKKELWLQVLHCSRITSDRKTCMLIHAFFKINQAFEGMRKKNKADYSPVASGDNDETSSGQHL
jgi:hypothetical protein